MRVIPERGFYLIILLCAIFIAILAITVGLTRDKAEEEYYRGLYDGCKQVTHQSAACLKGVANAKLFGYYEEPSQGWQWPLPKPSSKVVPKPSPTRSYDGGA